MIALSAASLPDARLSDFVKAARDAGFSAVHLFRDSTESNLAHQDLSVRSIRETLTAADVALTSCEIRALTGRKVDSDEHNLAYNIRQLEWDIHLCRALGVQTLSLRSGANTAQTRADLVEGVNQLTERISDVVLAVGPLSGSCLSTAADFETLTPSLAASAGLVLDTGALLAAGLDPVAFAQTWSAHLRLVYVRDVHEGASVTPGDGDLHLDALAKALQQIEFTGPVVVETPADSLDTARQRLRGW
jgi:sugar phosphate isomerase/epimerase